MPITRRRLVRFSREAFFGLHDHRPPVTCDDRRRRLFLILFYLSDIFPMLFNEINVARTHGPGYDPCPPHRDSASTSAPPYQKYRCSTLVYLKRYRPPVGLRRCATRKHWRGGTSVHRGWAATGGPRSTVFVRPVPLFLCKRKLPRGKCREQSSR